MKTTAWSWTAVAFIAGCAAPPQLLQQGDFPEASDRLAAIRRCIAVCEAGESVERCNMGHLFCPRAGYQFTREVQLSANVRIIVASFLHQGGLFAFDPNGALLASRETGRITSFQVFDFDADGTDELITEEQDIVGTGVEVRNYRVYRLSSSVLESLWEGLSYSFDGVSQPAEERQGFIRFADAGWAGPKIRLVHVEGRNGRFGQRVFVMDGGKFQERKELAVLEQFPRLSTSKDLYRPYSHPFPQIIQANDYPTIEAIESFLDEMTKFGGSTITCAAGETINLRSSNPHRQLDIAMRDNGTITFSGHSFSSDKTVALFSTLRRLLADLSQAHACAVVRFDQFTTRAYKRRSILEFDLGPTVVVVDAFSNGRDNEERLYILDAVERKDSFFWGEHTDG